MASDDGKRSGPRLTITGTCEGCAHLITDARDPRLGRGPHAACVHPSRANGGLIFGRARGPWPMPADCPEMGRARIALARSVVAEASPACFVKGDSIDGDDHCECVGDDATPDDACACKVDPMVHLRPGEHPICGGCGAEVYALGVTS